MHFSNCFFVHADCSSSSVFFIKEKLYARHLENSLTHISTKAANSLIHLILFTQQGNQYPSIFDTHFRVLLIPSCPPGVCSHQI